MLPPETEEERQAMIAALRRAAAGIPEEEKTPLMKQFDRLHAKVMEARERERSAE